MTCAPSASSEVPSAAIFSPLMPMSPTNVPAGVTTFPPLMTRSNLIFAAPQSQSLEPQKAADNCNYGRGCSLPLPFCGLLRPSAVPALRSANGSQSPIEYIERKIHVRLRNAHRRLDAEHA